MSWQKSLQTFKQYAFPRTAALARELETLRAEHETVSAALTSARDEFAAMHARDAQQLAELQQQLVASEAGHSTARQIGRAHV